MPYSGRHQLVRPRRRVVATAVAVALAVAGLSAADTVTNSSVALAESGTVSGTAYVDYNYDGTLNQTAASSTVYDNGIPGVTVQITDSTGAVVGSATTGSNGTYSASVTSAATADVRVRFTAPTGYIAGVHGAGAGTSVQFVKLNTSSAANVNVAYDHPGDYSQTSAPRILQAQEWGRIAAPTSDGTTPAFVDQSARPSLTSSTYTTTDTSGSTTTLALASQTGSIWGVAQVNNQFAFSAAHFRRHALVGPGGLGAIYLTNLNSGSANASSFVTIPSAGTNPRTSPSQDTMTANDWFHDSQAYASVGKVGLGGMAIAPDNSALYVVNLNNKTLYKVPLTYAADGTPSAGTPVAITMPTALPGAATGCAASSTRPFGVSAQNGALWVTETCVGTAASSLRGYVYRYDLGTASFGTSPAFEMALSGYNRGYTYSSAAANPATYLPWSDTFSTASSSSNVATGPQPLLSDVDFDSNGDMTIGVKDRYADEVGYFMGDTGTGSTTYEGFAGGDILRACGTEASGWTLENNGSCGSRTGYANGATDGSKSGPGDTQGPGGGEFYQDNYTNYHQQVALGGLLQVPGYPENVTSSFDPADIRTSGQRFENNSNGQTGRVHTIQAQVSRNSTGNITGAFSKAGGLGDLTALVQNAPIEIGNRLWFDTNANGIQDAGEAPVSGATVRLYDSAANVLDTAVTDANGNYYFSSASGTSTSSSRYNVTALKPNSSYTVRVDNASDYTGSGVLSGYGPTLSTAGSDRSLDSDGLASAATSVRAAVTTGGPGVNNQRIDFGFVKPVSVGDFVWTDSNRDGIQDAGEPGVEGAVVSITRADGSAATHSDGTSVPSTNTDANGKYSFTGLAPGVAYTVTVTTPDGDVATNANQGSDTSKDSSTGSYTTAVLAAGSSDLTADFGFIKPAVSVGDRVFIDANGNGIQDTGDLGLSDVKVTLVGPGGGGVTDINGTPVGAATTAGDGSYSFTLLPPLPTGQHYTVKIDNTQDALAGYRPAPANVSGSTRDNDSSTGSAESLDLTTNGASDTSLDFGFVGSVTVGNFVWDDLNGNGIQDTGEPGIPDVQVSIVGPDGNPVTNTSGQQIPTQTTSSGGGYRFVDLPQLAAGQHYTVKIDNTQSALAGAGYVPTKLEQGTDRSLDSSTSSADSRDDLTTPGASDPTLDFGFVKPVSVGDFVWKDTDRDGVQGSGEPGIAGVKVTVSRVDGAVVTAADGTVLTGDALVRTTGSDGKYLYDNLAPGAAYKVTVTTPPPGLIATKANVGGNTDADSSTGSETTGVLTSGGSDLSLDFGYVVPAVSVGDFVWNDIDRDGIQDSGEPGIAGVKVTIVNPDGTGVTDVYGNSVGAATTDSNGKYLFANLPALIDGSQYTVKIDNSQPALTGYIPTLARQGSSTDLDSSTSSSTTGDLTADGKSDLSIDFGFVVPTVSVGDFVWLDANGDGIQESGDTGIANVTVTLVGPTGNAVTDVYGNAVGSTTTDTDGKYSFVNLPALPAGQHYTVKIVNTQTALNGYAPTTAGAGGDRALDSSTSSSESGNLTTQGDRDATLDFGFVNAVSVGDFVWEDVNGNGVQDAGEPGITNVTVAITNSDGTAVTDLDGNSVTTTTTDANGHYSFAKLPPGSYTVTVTAPSGYGATVAGAGNDRDADSSTGSATSAALTSGSADTSLDFGFVKPVSVGDFVWRDRNGNGVQDADDVGISGVTVKITNAVDGSAVTDLAGNPVGPTTTDGDGKYTFAGLRPGRYVVSVTTPSGFAPTLANSSNATTATDSSTGSATSALLDSGGADTTLDFGFVKPVAVGDFVWNDVNRNGVQDAGEPGLAGVTVTISRPDGQTVLGVDGNPVPTTTTTDSTGHYLFDFLQPNQKYTVTVTNPDPSTYIPTLTGEGTTDTDSSNGSATTATTLTDVDVDRSLDFGFVLKAVTVGDYVWDDLDRNGIQDPTDKPIQGVRLTVVGPDGNPVNNVFGQPVAAATTDANGNYTFAALPVLPNAGDHYTVKIDNTQSALTSRGFIPTTAGAGTDRAVDSSTGSAESGNLQQNGDSDLTLDFGFIRPAVSVGDFVWTDTNGNGVQDTGEPGVPGVSLTIVGPTGNAVTDTDGNPVLGKVTDSFGKYAFTNLPALPAGQHYTVKIDNSQSALTSKGLVPTRTGVGTARSVDSSTGSSESGDLTTDTANDLSLDFGFVKPVSVGDFAWVDSNGNGVQDAGEPGLDGVTLKLTTTDDKPVKDVDNNTVAPIITGPNGNYTIADLQPGTYKVIVVDSPAGYVPTTSGAGTPTTDSSTGSAITSPLNSGATDTSIDFGFVKPVSVGNFVWSDTNGNGVQDAGEPGLAGVTVKLTTNDGTPVTDVNNATVGPITTTSNGAYEFTNLLPGTYKVVVVGTPPGYLPTKTGAGTTATDSSKATATSAPLASGGSDDTLDFGFVRGVSVGDFVWHDLDGDGIQGANEPGIAGVTVTISHADGSPVLRADGVSLTADQLTVTTDAQGKYEFTALAPGQYIVTVTRPAGYLASPAGVGTNTGADSSTGSAQSGVLASGDSDQTLDFGFVSHAVSVGDYVWNDKDGDGIQESGESGIEGVVLTLAGPDGLRVTNVFGQAVGAAATDKSGHYVFADLPALPAGKHYTVTEDATASAKALDGFVPTRVNVGSSATDSSSGSAESGNLVTDGAADLTLDFGYLEPVTVGRQVFVDNNRDGRYDKGDTGIKGVVVTLTDDKGNPVTDVNGNPVGPVTTDGEGHFSFGDLWPGQYVAHIDNDQPALSNYSPTKSGSGSATSVALSDDLGSGESDLGLRFGFVQGQPSTGGTSAGSHSGSSNGSTPAGSNTSGDTADTGITGLPTQILLAMVLALAGVGLLLLTGRRGRRRRS